MNDTAQQPGPAPGITCTPGYDFAGRYRIICKLRDGRLGDVFLADERERQRAVVVKPVHRALLERFPALAERIEHEAGIVAALEHPHIVKLLGHGKTEDGQPYLVMEYADGRPLTSDLRLGAFAEDRALRIAGQICGALEAAHQRSILHRGLKPDEVMLCGLQGDLDHVKLLSFGIGRIADGGGAKRTFYAGAGCNFCSGTGYRDRIGVYEFLRITPEIKRLVVGWATQEELRRMAVSQGMRTLQEEAITLIKQDVTTISEVVRAIYAF